MSTTPTIEQFADNMRQLITTPRPSNVGEQERLGSLLIGGGLVLYGLTRSLPGLALTLVGGALVYRGLSGHCALYEQLGINTAHHSADALAAPPHQQDAVLGPVDNPIDLASGDSFPASDPPSFNA